MIVPKCKICSIINKSLQSFIVYEDDSFVAFLDIKPLFVGHCLLAPKKHFHTVYDLPVSLGNNLLEVIQIIGNAIKQAVKAEGTFIAINNSISQSIDHLHIHLVPRKKGDGLKGFFWPRMQYQNDEEMLAVQLSIKSYIDREMGK